LFFWRSGATITAICENHLFPIEVLAVTSSSVPSILALLAQPVSGNPTQYMIEKAFAHHDLDWRYLSFEIVPGDLADAIRGLQVLGFYGGHFGDPHKQNIIPHLDRTTETATAIGEVNLFFRDGDALVGDNVEGKAVLRSIEKIIDPIGKRFVILGAGGLARATALELAIAGAGGITIVNRSEYWANELVTLLTAKHQIPVSAVPWQDDYALPAEADVLINATSTGLQNANANIPLVFDSLRPEVLVVDVSTDPPQTKLLHEAAQRGCKTVDGLSIFIEQVALAIKLWTGVDPSRDVLRDAVEEYLEV
jgi:shikimate dehydrogenase